MENIKTMFEKMGYRVWKTDSDSTGIKILSQKRMDTLFPDIPVCTSNEKLFVNLDYFKFVFANGAVSEGFEMNLVHERPDGRWCDLKIYSISKEDLLDDVGKYEHTLISMWKTFYEESVK